MTTMDKVVELRTRSGYQPDCVALARRRVAAARRTLDCTVEAFASMLTPLVGWPVSADAVDGWENDSIPPGEVLAAADILAPAASAGGLLGDQPIGKIPSLIPPSFSV